MKCLQWALFAKIWIIAFFIGDFWPLGPEFRSSGDSLSNSYHFFF